MPEPTDAGQVARQLLRNGTAQAPGHAEARGAENDRDFIHELGIVLKELDEPLVLLNIIVRGAMLRQIDLTELQLECTKM